jgi:hypothetical protein
VGFDAGIYAFLRDGQQPMWSLIFLGDTSVFELNFREVITKWELKDGDYAIKDQLYSKSLLQLKVVNGVGKVQLKLFFESFITNCNAFSKLIVCYIDEINADATIMHQHFI